MTALTEFVILGKRPPGPRCRAARGHAPRPSRKPRSADPAGRQFLNTPSRPREQARVEGTLKAHRDRPGHDHVPVIAPRDLESPAVELDCRSASGESTTVRRDEGGTGATAAGKGDPGPALPHPQTDIPVLPDRRDADVRALGKQRVVLEDRPERRKIDRFYVGDKESRVRVPDVGADRC